MSHEKKDPKCYSLNRTAASVARSNAELGAKISNSNRELGTTLEKISQAEIKSKDRVNIPMEEEIASEDIKCCLAQNGFSLRIDEPIEASDNS